MANESTRTTLAGKMETILADAMAAFRLQAMLLSACASKDARGADVVKFGSTAIPAAASAHTETNDVSATAVTVSAVSLTPVPYAVRVDLTVEAQRGGVVLDSVGKAAGGGVARGLDTAIAALFADFTNSVGSAGTALTIAKILAAKAKIQAVGYVGEMVCIMHPGQIADILAAQLAVFTPARNDQIVSSGFLGNAYSMEWYMCPWVAVDGEDDATGAVMMKEAIACAYDSGPGGDAIIEFRDIPTIALENNMMFWSNMAADTLNDGAGVKVVSDVSSYLSSI